MTQESNQASDMSLSLNQTRELVTNAEKEINNIISSLALRTGSEVSFNIYDTVNNKSVTAYGYINLNVTLSQGAKRNGR